jgi:DNA-binding transcriptional ArsR family regulator
MPVDALPPSFDKLLAFFKALANEKRLCMVGLLLERPRNVKELAAALNLREPTVSHHLGILSGIRLVDMVAEGNTHWYRLREDELRQLGRSIFGEGRLSLARFHEAVPHDRRMLANYLDRGRLKIIPASRKKRVVVLRWLAEKFRTDRTYAEAEVNEIIERFHWDSATLRREMVGYRMLTRANGIYRRPPDAG